MTVKQLMKKLAKLPQDAVVTIPNNYYYREGCYEATKVEAYGDDEVCIATDYKKRVEVDE